MIEKDDLTRLRQEYKHRELNEAGKNLYSYFYDPYAFAVFQSQRILLGMLKKNNLHSLQGLRILEVGCGSGGVLLEYLTLGANPGMLFGIDLLFDRLEEAHRRILRAGIGCADGQDLPCISHSFDLVMQYTAFSSVLDSSIKEQMAKEMLRVLKPDGMIIWYDFWLNPTNKQTLGIRPNEIKHLFPNCSFQFKKITLAPPIARRIVPVSWGLALFLESLKVMNSHYLTIIKKTDQN
jgi:ubiquinone/menaquinone biosynthesis C-methylase UbiE